MTSKRTGLSRRLRRVPTDAEALLWRNLRSRQVAGYKFRRQYAVGSYVVDFFCHETGLVIEVDGSQHQENADDDAIRTRYLETLGLRVIRFTNREVLTETESVLESIFSQLRADPSP